jgi:DNA-binding MarR family transcriptional regulator
VNVIFGHMATKTAPIATGLQQGLTTETLETSRLLLDFLNAAYAARNASGEPGPAGMSSHAARAAIYIHRHGERSIGQLAAGLGISYGWASRVVDELEAAGYVSRERDRRDHRVVRIRLDPAAIGAIERAYRWHEKDVTEALRQLSTDEREGVRTFLRTITVRLRGTADERPGSGSQP